MMFDSEDITDALKVWKGLSQEDKRSYLALERALEKEGFELEDAIRLSEAIVSGLN